MLSPRVGREADAWTGIATPEELAGFQAVVASFRTYAPYWDGVRSRPRRLLSVVERAIVKDTGAFLSHWGNQTFLR